MNWEKKSQYRIESPEGYIISKSQVSETATAYVARAPKGGVICGGQSCDDAKTACETHLQECRSCLTT